MNSARIVKIAKALADPTRLKILRTIRDEGSMNCSQVCESFPLSQPTISHHLRTLEQAGLISVRKEAQYHILSARVDVLESFASMLTETAPVSEAAPAPAPKPKSSRGRPGGSAARKPPARQGRPGSAKG